MSEYTFGDGEYEGDPSGLGAEVQEQGPKWFRSYMDKVSGQLNELKAENERLQADKRRTQVADTLKAKGYAPDAAGLYSGEPDGLDDWLKNHGAALAKLPSAPGEESEEQETPAGPPPSTVPADGQDAMQRMTEAGTAGAAAPQGTDKELESAIRAAQTPEEFNKIMRAHGSQYDW